MKRLAFLILSAGLFGPGPATSAADPINAPTVPSIPAPVLRGEVLAPTGPGAGLAPVNVQYRGPGDRLLTAPRALPTSSQVQPQLDQNQPRVVTPAIPTGVGAYPVGGVPCNGGACAPVKCSGNCWDKVKNWFCFRQTPVHLGLHPTPCEVPPGSLFPCTSTGACGSGCGKVANCGHGPRVGLGSGCKTCPILPVRGTAAGCVPVAPDPVLPGYRFASPEAPGFNVPPVQTPITNSSFKQPAPPTPSPHLPYKTASYGQRQ